MVPELQKGMESLGAYDMANQLKDMFQRQARQERFDNVKALSECNMAPGSSVSVHVLKMKSYIDQLERLGFPIGQELATDFILSSLSSSYEPFVLNYQMNNLEKTIMELHGMLKTAESNMAKSKPAAPVLAIREGGIKKKKATTVKGKGKGKAIQSNPKPKTKGQGKAQSNIPQSKTPEDAVCFYCKEVGHWRRSCPKYLEELKKLKVNGASTSGTYMTELHSTSTSNSWVLDTGCGTHICTNVQGLKRSRKVRRGELDLIMGNKQIASVDMIGNYELSFSSGLSVVLIDCCYSVEMARNIISFYALYKDGFDFGFDNGSILVYKNNVLYFKANPCHGIYETSITVRDNRSSIYNVESTQSKNGLDKSYMWHCRPGHISKKHITKLQSDVILESFDHTSNDECESCLLGKMTKAPFTGTCERGKDLLDIVHTDVCGPFRSATRHGERYFVTFTNDFSRYGYVYLIKHKSETIEVFKTFQNEVENQLNRKIKTLRSDRGGEYLSQEFQDHLRSCGIIAQLTPPRTPQHNGVAERRNRTLLDMVRSMMSRTVLPISLWGYALETAARVLNRPRPCHRHNCRFGFDFRNDRCVVAVAKHTGIVCVDGEHCFLGVVDAVGCITYPKSSITQILRLIVGRLFSDPDLQQDLKAFPFSVTEGPDGFPLIHAHYRSETKSFTPIQVMGMVFSNMKRLAEKILNAPVIHCCIGIPVYFTDLQRRAVLEAAKIAGLNPLRLMHETTAAALAYGLYKRDLSENMQINVAFLDIGYDSMQVCIAAFKKGEMRILAHSFDRLLGGRDFVEVLFQRFAEKFKTDYKIDVFQNSSACSLLRSACDKLKEALRSNPEAPLYVECLIDQKYARGFIKRDEFEQISTSLLERLKKPLNKAFSQAKIPCADVEVVGSDSWVIKLLKFVFGTEPTRTMNARECVSRGCALQCAILSPNFKVKEFQVQEILPFSIALQSKLLAHLRGTDDYCVVFLSGNPIPSAKSVTFCRYYYTFYVDVQYEHARELQAPPKINTFKIGPFLSSTDELCCKVEVEVGLNWDGCVTVNSAQRIKETGVNVPIPVSVVEQRKGITTMGMDITDVEVYECLTLPNT
ncbi:hypothetical protein OSB04_030857 [Centaurea solstitialis]|uniref:Polyprotein n=1 Tax=Centaurea solstitialis TaxID=347529 RepID=A0AA38S7U8_9ASTR|nr:hypothetical protein OSB04_030857 [Centaurea solstitialis]